MYTISLFVFDKACYNSLNSHVTSSPRGGGFQRMTIDDKGEGGVLPMIRFIIDFKK